MAERTFVIRRTGFFLYTKRATWAFVWNCRWFWLPSVVREEVRGGWWIHWGWFMLEKFAFDPWDDWGAEREEQLADVLDILENNLQKAEQLAPRGEVLDQLVQKLPAPQEFWDEDEQST